jgi:hypothetical protein
MAELTPQERFNKLNAFLKDPQNQTYVREENFHGIWSLFFPNLSLEDVVWLNGRKQSAAMVQEIRQEAIEIMESGMLSEEGGLKGNQKIKDIPIDRLESFILQMAVAYRIGKTSDHFLDFDNRPKAVEEVLEENRELEIALRSHARKMLDRRFNTEKELMRAHVAIHAVMSKALMRAISLNVFEFGFVKEIVSIFLNYLPHAPINLIAFHIHHFLTPRQHSKLKGIYVPSQEALRQEIRRRLQKS